MAGRTTIIIAHRLSTITLANDVVVLDRGVLAAHGTHAELLVGSQLYREIIEQTEAEQQPARRRRIGAAPR